MAFIAQSSACCSMAGRLIRAACRECCSAADRARWFKTCSTRGRATAGRCSELCSHSSLQPTKMWRGLSSFPGKLQNCETGGPCLILLLGRSALGCEGWQFSGLWLVTESQNRLSHWLNFVTQIPAPADWCSDVLAKLWEVEETCVLCEKQIPAGLMVCIMVSPFDTPISFHNTT